MDSSLCPHFSFLVYGIRAREGLRQVSSGSKPETEMLSSLRYRAFAFWLQKEPYFSDDAMAEDPEKNAVIPVR